MKKTAHIDQYLKSKKVTADTKITLALLIELLDGFKTNETPGNVSPQAAENYETIKDVLHDVWMKAWSSTSQTPQEMWHYLDIKTKELQSSAPLSPVPVKEEGDPKNVNLSQEGNQC